MCVAWLILFVSCACYSAFVVRFVYVVFSLSCLSFDCGFWLCVLSLIDCAVCVACAVAADVCVCVVSRV